MRSTKQALVLEGIQGSCRFMELGLGNEKEINYQSNRESMKIESVPKGPLILKQWNNLTCLSNL